jgi:hypothetical protein
MSQVDSTTVSSVTPTTTPIQKGVAFLVSKFDTSPQAPALVAGLTAITEYALSKLVSLVDKSSLAAKYPAETAILDGLAKNL